MCVCVLLFVFVHEVWNVIPWEWMTSMLYAQQNIWHMHILIFIYIFAIAKLKPNQALTQDTFKLFYSHRICILILLFLSFWIKSVNISRWARASSNKNDSVHIHNTRACSTFISTLFSHLIFLLHVIHCICVLFHFIRFASNWLDPQPEPLLPAVQCVQGCCIWNAFYIFYY